MGRQLRPVAEGLVYHAVNRGNNRAAVFFAAADYRAFLDALRQTKERYPFLLYGYCLMTNHFHLVLQPAAGRSIIPRQAVEDPWAPYGPTSAAKAARSWLSGS